MRRHSYLASGALGFFIKLILATACFAAIPILQEGEIAGVWQGALKVSGIELRIVFKISKTPEGKLAATLDSPDQGAKDIPVSEATFENGELKLEVKSVANGATDEAIAKNRNLQKRMFMAVKEEKEDAEATKKLRSILQQALSELTEDEKKAVGFASSNPDTLLRIQIKQVLSPWFCYFLTYDPQPSFKELPRLNHLFQTSQTGAPSEYAKIEETISLAALQMMGDWI
jgi:hypothetical protein